MEDLPSYGPVHNESVYVLTGRNALRIPPPPTMRNHGNVVFSLSQLGRWLGERVNIFPRKTKRLDLADDTVHQARFLK